jgi:transcriptional regulator with XRE-family HTH domain
MNVASSPMASPQGPSPKTAVPQIVGEVLRRARLSRGLTLRQVEQLSNGRFKPSSVAGYERAERRISVESFVELASTYGVPPERLLSQVLDRLLSREEASIDLKRRDPAPLSRSG